MFSKTIKVLDECATRGQYGVAPITALASLAWEFAAPENSSAYQSIQKHLAPFAREVLGMQAKTYLGTEMFQSGGFTTYRTLCDHARTVLEGTAAAKNIESVIQVVPWHFLQRMDYVAWFRRLTHEVLPVVGMALDGEASDLWIYNFQGADDGIRYREPVTIADLKRVKQYLLTVESMMPCTVRVRPRRLRSSVDYAFKTVSVMARILVSNSIADVRGALIKRDRTTSFPV